ncbi:winged helix DNA-binding protein [Mangrovibrevibacter kandeliae]|uniref:winged helix DNA-binding protein n=1 Tax=Mangrovibrevibacter kandeliae TaxID=2968473 RepID=UPI00211931DE|nr:MULTISPECIES: winged helix DNA-binding protein [unclassified Aurantimonas]MCQ8784282.1 winged helix DNA-binding protein [Aurantimonas sp. CSK15Z-1]MCW4117038.1 winged helix DNA-binding protein [Aurantimonas sp. MSK8Z-1]
MARKPAAPTQVSRTASLGPIVSSAHLADGAFPQLSEVEFGMILSQHAFERWMVRCMTAAGAPGLTPTEILVLHNVNHRGRAKRLADICLVLGIEDTHLVSYAVKKLEARKLVAREKAGKERLVSITSAGATACGRYRDLREAVLVEAVQELGLSPEAMSNLAALLRVLSGHYDQAARTAASL